MVTLRMSVTCYTPSEIGLHSQRNGLNHCPLPNPVPRVVLRKVDELPLRYASYITRYLCGPPSFGEAERSRSLPGAAMTPHSRDNQSESFMRTGS